MRLPWGGRDRPHVLRHGVFTPMHANRSAANEIPYGLVRHAAMRIPIYMVCVIPEYRTAGL